MQLHRRTAQKFDVFCSVVRPRVSRETIARKRAIIRLSDGYVLQLNVASRG